jgi:hypothetical protein
MERAGFRLIKSEPLRSMERKGLYERVRYDRNVGTATATVLYCAALFALTISRVATSDIHYFVFKMRTPGEPADPET